jgi:ElaB/YqjD/DUF883 family membrane-anchored ribosome-binding protein
MNTSVKSNIERFADRADDVVATAKDKADDAVTAAKNKADDVVSTVKDKANDAVTATKETVNAALDRGQATVAQAGRAATHMAHQASDQVSGLAGELEALVGRNPLAVLAGAVVIGILIGSLSRRNAS